MLACSVSMHTVAAHTTTSSNATTDQARSRSRRRRVLAQRYQPQSSDHCLVTNVTTSPDARTHHCLVANFCFRLLDHHTPPAFRCACTAPHALAPPYTPGGSTPRAPSMPTRSVRCSIDATHPDRHPLRRAYNLAERPSRTHASPRSTAGTRSIPKRERNYHWMPAGAYTPQPTEPPLRTHQTPAFPHWPGPGCLLPKCAATQTF